MIGIHVVTGNQTLIERRVAGCRLVLWGRDGSNFFGRNLDLALGTGYAWARPGRFFFFRWRDWFRMLRHVGEYEVLVKPLGPLVRRLPHVAGATILADGQAVPVLNPHELLAGRVLLEPDVAGARHHHHVVRAFERGGAGRLVEQLEPPAAPALRPGLRCLSYIIIGRSDRSSSLSASALRPGPARPQRGRTSHQGPAREKDTLRLREPRVADGAPDLDLQVARALHEAIQHHR
jgi:hypothetical protein